MSITITFKTRIIITSIKFIISILFIKIKIEINVKKFIYYKLKLMN